MVYNLYLFLISIKQVWASSTPTIIEILKAATLFRKVAFFINRKRSDWQRDT